jgi:hypothetical protein
MLNSYMICILNKKIHLTQSIQILTCYSSSLIHSTQIIQKQNQLFKFNESTNLHVFYTLAQKIE